MPTSITPEQIRQVAQILEDLPAVLARLGEDGRRVEAFYKDWVEATEACLVDPMAAQKLPTLLQVPAALIAEVALAKKSFAWYKPRTWDVFSGMRKRAKVLAEVLEFERYNAELANGQK